VYPHTRNAEHTINILRPLRPGVLETGRAAHAITESYRARLQL